MARNALVLILGVYLWFVCCTLKSILFIYLFLIASVKQNRPLYQESGNYGDFEKFFLRFVDSTNISGILHILAKQSFE